MEVISELKNSRYWLSGVCVAGAVIISGLVYSLGEEEQPKPSKPKKTIVVETLNKAGHRNLTRLSVTSTRHLHKKLKKLLPDSLDDLESLTIYPDDLTMPLEHNIELKEPVEILSDTCSPGHVEIIKVLPGDQHFVTGCVEGIIKVWSIDQSSPIMALEGHVGKITDLDVFPDGNKIVSSALDKKIKIWDLETGTCQKTIVGHTRYISTVNISSDCKKIISAGNGNRIRVWDIETGECESILDTQFGIFIYYMFFIY
eukprot:TRINITY_DN1426_c0_g2_i1.p1 TRINITY_DN1426_c0_g2~~TRINITY_DN1426_c0_g2_i1.p1  ORF type:complete len:257 (+),score=50.47 TRINITY_DN1426_c0_g2_i1:1-771(+)